MLELLVGDPHISHKRLERSQSLLNEIIEEWKSRPEITSCIVLGDVFDEHEWLHVACTSIWQDFLDKAKPLGIVSHVLGNHEMLHASDYLPTMHALRGFAGNTNYKIYDKPTTVDGRSFVPFMPTGKFYDALGMLPVHKGLLFCHQEFKGSVDSEKGDALPGAYWNVISGHIHEPMRIGNVWYPGAPIQTNFGEANNKAIYVIDTSENDYKIKSKISLGLPCFITIPIEWNAVEKPALIVGEYYRFEVKTNKANALMFKNSALYRELAQIGKVKITVEVEKKIVTKASGSSFRSALADLIANSDLGDVANEVIA